MAEDGLTLVEVLAALTVFALVTVGVFPLVASSIRGASLSRSRTIGKNVAVRAMERIRGLPFARSVATTSSARKVDVLDLFFPCAPDSNANDPACAATAQPAAGSTGTRYVYTGTLADALRPAEPIPTGTFVTTCTAVTVATNAACPRSLTTGYSIRFDAQFVAGSDTNPETYTVLNSTTSPAVPTTYNWSAVGTEVAPSQIVKIRVSVYWEAGDETELYTLESLVADRKLAVEKIGGAAKVNYAVRVLTSYDSGGPALSDLAGTGASSVAGITSRLTAVAEEVATGGQASLSTQATDTTEAVPLASPPPVGATGSYAAPPDQTSLPDPSATAAAQVMSHPELCQNPVLTPGSGCQLKQVSYLGASHIKEASVAIAGDLPLANGSALFNPISPTTFDMYVDPQRNADPLSKNPLQLEANTVYNSTGLIDHPAFSIRPDSGVANNTNCLPNVDTPTNVTCRSMFATTNALTAALTSATRRVETTATTGFAQMRLFPATFIPGSQGASKSVFEINNFAARVNCKATGSTGGSNPASATASWSATLRYWRENNTNDGNTSGSYQSVNLTSSNFTTVISDLKSSNPMIYEESELGLIKLLQPGDVYMFPKQNLLQGGEYPSFLADLTGSPGSAPVTEGGTVASATIGGALTFSTNAYIDPDVPQSAMNIILGSLTCSTADRRTE